MRCPVTVAPPARLNRSARKYCGQDKETANAATVYIDPTPALRSAARRGDLLDQRGVLLLLSSICAIALVDLLDAGLPATCAR